MASKTWQFQLPNEDLSEEEAFAHIDGLMERFQTSPEFHAHADGENQPVDIALLFEMGYQYDGLFPAHFEFSDFHDVLHDLFPRKVSMPAEKVPAMVNELKAYLRWAKRELGYVHADDCLERLDPDFVAKVTARMGDLSLFGMAKSLVSGGAESGFDMHSEHGLQQAMDFYNARLEAEPESLPFPNFTFGAPEQVKRPNRSSANKNKRKMKKSSRRKNR